MSIWQGASGWTCPCGTHKSCLTLMVIWVQWHCLAADCLVFESQKLILLFCPHFSSQPVNQRKHGSGAILADEGVEEGTYGEFMFGKEIYILFVKANSQNTYILFIKGGGNKEDCITVSEKITIHLSCWGLYSSLIFFFFFTRCWDVWISKLTVWLDFFTGQQNFLLPTGMSTQHLLAFLATQWGWWWNGRRTSISKSLSSEG